MASTSEAPAAGTGPDGTAGLHDHGDRQVPPGATDLAVNVWPGPPAWLVDELAALDLAGYPDTSAARAVAAGRHGLSPEQCLLTNGAAEAFWALAHALRPRRAACVHPSFTAPEAALRSTGTEVRRVLRRARDDFALDPAHVPEDADLLVLGRPDNPTGRLEPVEVVRALTRPGRVVVVDEAFAEFLPDATGVAGADLPGVLSVRSLTKVWGLAGLRVGYLTGAADLVARVAGALQPWPVSTPAAHAVARLCHPDAEPERAVRAARVQDAREALLARLRETGLTAPEAGPASDGAPLSVWPSPANYVLLRGPLPDLRERLLEHGLAARRCTTFPGLDGRYVRVAVPLQEAVRERLVSALRELLPGQR
ncbi:aminotransferase class I/II-fold pyridoxal phosphate-dependent enzyme [Ornithinicoccus halotolerans]|uniref:aminotransferase class I/II-fold pyridoxal phosphate-dependent enzyme n=1 Tax=Ornithinicoccus halotolerans TaxID=1748220 RepID=UPI001E2E10DB|nr:aminotransferase class I/II-fold pyridoxal phosphate-dependent enzyme [Ornithinicoccus halotolerans]